MIQLTIDSSCKPTISSEILSRLGNCEVCNINQAKYTCPKCELKTCSLYCVNIHKKELDCDGIRDKVKFVPLQKFNNLELQNDFNMLEQISNSLFKYKRDPVKNAISMYNKLPYQLHILRKYAYNKKVQLRFLPRLFTKHKMNTSCVHKNKLYWRIEWVFVNSNIKYIDEKLIDSTRLCVALKKHLDNPELAYYKSAAMNGILILMKRDRSSKFYILENSSTICENLKNKCIIEFPIFYVIFKYEKDIFEIEDDFEPNNPNDEPEIGDQKDVEKKNDVPSDENQQNKMDIFVVNDNTIQNEFSSICYEYDY